MTLAIRSQGQLPRPDYATQLLGPGNVSERAPLVPDGGAVEAHFPKLYPANRSQQVLQDYARPSAEAFGALLIPAVFRKEREGLRCLLQASDAPAAQWLNARGEDERLLKMLVHLLVEV
ncbi:YscX family type III secretion protein [Pseudomonas fontis]|uniref:YscX family type III secretion protein n=1 Tax=Pseudomonas fontis TaxID=2942633 RepID=A0ABT5NZT4_9PSED|nr:YscX family type III secretion protein [Pseudomonas fontis]MDD0976397.1 YscX family type III secretion protein [Pseudomonas fontis]MDD0993717.1 YscX family type III secretion protein [Pseudomonas fontis]